MAAIGSGGAPGSVEDLASTIWASEGRTVQHKIERGIRRSAEQVVAKLVRRRSEDPGLGSRSATVIIEHDLQQFGVVAIEEERLATEAAERADRRDAALGAIAKLAAKKADAERLVAERTEHEAEDAAQTAEEQRLESETQEAEGQQKVEQLADVDAAESESSVLQQFFLNTSGAVRGRSGW